MSKKKTTLIVILILLLFSLVLGSVWGYGQYQKFKSVYFNPLNNDNGRVNILVLGINGSGGADQDLTDTIIFASLRKSPAKAVFISVPRDIWVEEIKAKINTAYHYGGIDLAKETIADILGQPIHYFAVINFESFEKIIDYLGGMRVEVTNSFDDYKYPIPGKEKDLCDGDKELKCRYEHLHFEKGWQMIGGSAALKFSRSRNAEGDEGTDYARSMRQQKVMLAIKNQIVNEKLYLRPQKMVGLLNLVQQEVKTDIKPEIYGSLALVGYQVSQTSGNINMTAINGNLLVNPKNHYSKQWVLVPKDNGWEGIRQYVLELLGK